MKIKKTHPADISIGDTIIINGNLKTVGKDTIKVGFCGTLVDGERLKMVEQVLFPRWYKGEILGYFAQI